jgi:activator of 2-hydroxyglutaryl-CoA dehydratase/predicted nucleotide-binding protein (sugar kinase/HSP70/actin superfamily)
VLSREEGALRIVERCCLEHRKDPGDVLVRCLRELKWDITGAAAATGRLSRGMRLVRVPTQAALARGVRFAFPDHEPGTVVSIGSHGFSVLELRAAGQEVYRENFRCSQGTGNFLRQLVERFELTVDQASRLCASVEKPAALSGRCPVILKTDMTHLANKGEDRAAIVAGLYDAVCENVQVLLKPGISPSRVLLAGGVMRAERVRENFRRFLEPRGMELVDAEVDSTLYLEALGAALVAAERNHPAPELEALAGNREEAAFERVPALRDSLSRIRRMPPVPWVDGQTSCEVVIGFDIGSTGSMALALDVREKRPVWEAYLDTLGNPVAAAQKLAALFLEQTANRHHVRAIGATGSGREIVGSLMATCFGGEAVFVMNEIAAHAEGAHFFDPEVDTIFEIGGQDAKYTRLEGGRIIDAAMNEACSAGTGSFIEEQGGKFEGISDVGMMGRIALEAKYGVSLGQHCSVFMAEVIDEAVAANVPRASILAGLYDSVVQNFLNRVKGNRPVGRRIFCQGMPFNSDALAAAVARQTGRTVIVPPNPGTIGALGIALLVSNAGCRMKTPIDLRRFLDARVQSKDVIVCRSTKGCGGSGNQCRIDRIQTVVEGKEQSFLWGGNCSLYGSGSKRRKLPDRAPDPFRERRELVQRLIENRREVTGRPRIVLIDEFPLKGLLPFFIEFFDRLGFDVTVAVDAGHKALKRGIEVANVPFCAPMQIYQGIVDEILTRDRPDYLFLPRVRELPRHKGELHAVTCPIVQASPDILRRGAGPVRTCFLTSRIDVGPGNLESARFKATTRALARQLRVQSRWKAGHEAGCRAQSAFESSCRDIGERALAFAEKHGVVPVVVLGRNYTIHNEVLNSNVPNLLREQGALAIPVDCYTVADSVPIFPGMFWGYGQTSLRAAHQVRRTDGQYAIYCSNYSCGPDSFNLHFFSYIMENKPCAVIETDGHSGDAGTKTRIEAFLHCVEADRRSSDFEPVERPKNDFLTIDSESFSVIDARRGNEVLLIPRMGPGAETLAAVLAAEGGRVEALPIPTRESLRLGRKYTSGKECVPLTITLGSLLERLERDRGKEERYAFFMPRAAGPCRFGVYNLLHKILLEKTGWGDRVRMVSPTDADYFAEVSPDLQVRLFAGFAATDMLQAALHHVRPVEKTSGLAQAIHDHFFGELKTLLRRTGPRKLLRAVGEVFNGIFGLRDLLRRAGLEFAAAKDFSRDVPTVALVGEIYVRLDPFANDFLIEKLEERGLRVLLAPIIEWLMYTTSVEIQRFREDRVLPGDGRISAEITRTLQKQIVTRLHRTVGGPLGWNSPTGVGQVLRAARPYINPELTGEAVLTLGGPVHEYRHGVIDGVVAIGPHECMPNKIVEAQLPHVGEETGLLSLALSVNGDPLDPEVLDRFAFQVVERYRKRRRISPEQSFVPGPLLSPFDYETPVPIPTFLSTRNKVQ